MGTIGWPQLLIVALLILLLFGSRKLPEMARGLGQSLKIFKAETKDLSGDASADQPAIKPDDKATTSEPSASEQTTQQQKNESA